MRQERQQQRFGGLRVAIAVDAQSHQGECFAVQDALEELGAVPLILADQRGQVGAHSASSPTASGSGAEQASSHARAIEAHSTLALAAAEDLDAVVVPGGSSQLAQDAALQRLASEMIRVGKPLALSGTAMSLLMTTGLASGKRLTGPANLASEARAAGALWIDGPAVNDGMLVTGRGPEDLPAFIELLIDLLAQWSLQGQDEAANDIISATGEDG